MLFISVDRTPILENVTSFKTILNYENIDNDIFWGNLNNLNSFDELVNTLSDVIKKNTKVMPFKGNKYKKKQEWMSEDILCEMRIRDLFFRYKKKYPEDQHVIELYNSYKKKVKKLVYEAKQIITLT